MMRTSIPTLICLGLRFPLGRSFSGTELIEGRGASEVTVLFKDSLIMALSLSAAFSVSESAYFCIFRMARSAFSFASFRMDLASSLAAARIFSLDSESFCLPESSSCWSLSISALVSLISRCFFSKVRRFSSRSERTLLNLSSSSLILFFASSIILSGRFKRFEMAKALLLPGTPVRIL